jgi:hypothetical protein
MKTKVILTTGLIAAYGLTHVVAGADVPGKPLTLLANVVNVASSTSSGSFVLANLVVVPNMANPYEQDFVLPAKDPRAGKITLRSSG